MRRIIVLCLLLWMNLPLRSFARTDKGQWCGYALIEGIPNIEVVLPMLTLITPEEQSDSQPDDLFQTRLSLDGSKALIEGCWKIFPSREVVLNLIGLGIGGDAKDALDQQLTYSLFAPDASHDDAAVSVRQYLSEHIKEWELPEE